LFLATFFAVAAWGGTPDPPTIVSPPDGTQGVPAHASLCVEVVDSQAEPLDVTFFARELTVAPSEDFTIVVLPDSQYYAQTFPDVYKAQTSWIVENRETRNIVFVSHVGDIVHLAAAWSEWVNVDAAMSLLEDPTRTVWPDGIPHGYSVGNHDQHPQNAGSLEDEDATTQNFNAWFGVPKFENRSYYGGHFAGSNDNSYQFFSGGGMDFIIVHLEFDRTEFEPELRQAVLDWADQLLKTHADKRAIIVSHSLLCTKPDSFNSVHCPATDDAEFSGQGQETYDALKDNPNLFLMLCGHSSGSEIQPRRADVYENRTVYTLLSNYQRQQPCPFRCGNGWLRIMTFSTNDDEIVVETYSPWLGRTWDGANPDHHNFTLAYDMNGGLHFEEIGAVNGIASGMTACLDWTGRDSGSEYEWYVDVHGSEATVTGARSTFTSAGSCSLDGDCNDGDLCTIDSCVDVSCMQSPIPDCCETDTDCDDGNPCTDDSCQANTCTHSDNSHPCYDGSECTENDACTGGECIGTAIVCSDENACTVDGCAEGDCQFDYEPTAACCVVDLDCDDGNYCTLDRCGSNGACLNDLDPACCNVDNECEDGNLCTNDRCMVRNAAALRLDELYDHVSMGDYLIETVNPQPPGTNAREFTVECWFKWNGGGLTAATSGYIWDPSDVGGVEGYPLVAKGVVDQEIHPGRPEAEGHTSVNYFFGISEPGHTLVADMEEHPSGAAISRNHPVYGTTQITPGVWYHSAVTYDGQCWQLYLNGQPETDGTNCPRQPPAYETRHFFSIGVGQGWVGLVRGSFLGLMDEVRLWSRGLSQAEIQTNMYLQIESAPDLRGRWGFNEPGLVVEDSTGNGNQGAVVNADFESFDVVDLGEPVCDNRAPSEVLHLIATEPSPTRLRWVDSRSGFLYDVAYGSLSWLRDDGGARSAQCLSEDLGEAVYRDHRLPAPGTGYYYLVREDGNCDDGGTYGFDSSGAERLPPNACE